MHLMQLKMVVSKTNDKLLGRGIGRHIPVGCLSPVKRPSLDKQRAARPRRDDSEMEVTPPVASRLSQTFLHTLCSFMHTQKKFSVHHPSWNCSRSVIHLEIALGQIRITSEFFGNWLLRKTTTCWYKYSIKPIKSWIKISLSLRRWRAPPGLGLGTISQTQNIQTQTRNIWNTRT